MFRSLPLFIGLRYTRAKRRNQFISFVSGFSLLGMALGVMALIIVLSVMNGLDREMKERILRVIPHGFVELNAESNASLNNVSATSKKETRNDKWEEAQKIVEAHPNVLATAPYTNGSGVLSLGRQGQWSEIQGVVPEREENVSLIGENMFMGELEDLRAGQWGIVLGRTLARFLGVSALGEYVTVTTPHFSSTLLGPSPTTKRFRIVGIFEVGAQVDNGLAMIHLEDAKKLYRAKDREEGLHVKVDDIYRAADVMQSVGKELNAHFGDTYHVKDWSQTQGNLFQAVKMEKIMVMVLLMIIVAIAAFNIITSLVLMVADKRSDIAVLRTLGMTAKQVMGVFIVQGSVVGFVGIMAGVLLGVIGALYLSEIVELFEGLLGQTVFDPNVYYIPSIPSLLKWSDVVVVCSVAIFLSVLATLYPAYRASKIEPAEALRYE
ncbi:MAG: lipoprotein-releasing ABC transporter permease subunit [Cellvibrionaceae bacterium]